jgi:hypothetical protein
MRESLVDERLMLRPLTITFFEMFKVILYTASTLLRKLVRYYLSLKINFLNESRVSSSHFLSKLIDFHGHPLIHF